MLISNLEVNCPDHRIRLQQNYMGYKTGSLLVQLGIRDDFRWIQENMEPEKLLLINTKKDEQPLNFTTC